MAAIFDFRIFCRGQIILFQPCSAARWKIQISLHVYIEHFWTVIIFFTQSLPEIIKKKQLQPPPPPGVWMVTPKPMSTLL